jgi:xanthine dehydrogenase accessory factor
MEVAVSISAELLSFGTASQSRGPRRGVSWPQLRDLMKHEPETPQQPVETK